MWYTKGVEIEELNRKCAEFDGYVFYDKPEVDVYTYIADSPTGRWCTASDVPNYTKDFNAAQRIIDMCMDSKYVDKFCRGVFEMRGWSDGVQHHPEGRSVFHSKYIKERLEVAVEVLTAR